MKGTQMASKAQKEQDDRAAKKAQIADLKIQLEAGKKAQLDKLEKSKEHLVAQLEVASEKYLTVNGYMQARSVIQEVTFGDMEGADDFGVLACTIAREMSELATMLAKSIDDTDVFNLGEFILDGYLEKNFVVAAPTTSYAARQLLVVNLLQNVGPALDDILSFRESTSEQIKVVEDELGKLNAPTLKAVK